MTPAEQKVLDAALAELNAASVKAEKLLAVPLKKLQASLAKMQPKKMKIGAAADLLYTLDNVNAHNQLAKPFNELLAAACKQLEDFFVNELEEGDSSGVQGMICRVQINGRPVPTITDWTKFYAHIAKTKQFDLLNKAPNTKAIRERWDDKKQVPGVGTIRVKSVSCTKLARAKKEGK